MSLTQAREQVAAQLTDLLDGVTVHPHRPNVVRVWDGWLTLRQVGVSTFRTAEATFEVVIVLGTAEDAAEDALDRFAVGLLDAITSIGGATPVVPLQLILDGGGLFCCSASVVVEIE